MVRVDPSFPVALRVSGRSCLVVGGGSAAARKVGALLECGAIVTVIAPEIDPAIAALGPRCEPRPYQLGEAATYQLVFAATGIRAVDHQVFLDAEDAGVFINAVDDPANCSFLSPALARVGPVFLAVGTDGQSPALASYLRDCLANALPENLQAVTALLSRVRQTLIEAGHKSEGLPWQQLIEELFAKAPGADPARSEARREQLASSFLASALK